MTVVRLVVCVVVVGILRFVCGSGCGYFANGGDSCNFIEKPDSTEIHCQLVLRQFQHNNKKLLFIKSDLNY